MFCQQLLNFAQINFGIEMTVNFLAIIDTYETCMINKQHRKYFQYESSYKTMVHIELVHVDVYGKISIIVFRISYYFLLIINDYNSKIWMYFFGIKLKLLVNLFRDINS